MFRLPLKLVTVTYQCLPHLQPPNLNVDRSYRHFKPISKEWSREKEEKSDTWHRVERSSDKFLRRLWLPESGKVEGVKVTMENGVLMVTMPKEEVKKVDLNKYKMNNKINYKPLLMREFSFGTVNKCGQISGPLSPIARCSRRIFHAVPQKGSDEALQAR
ncbi:hypothetical protein ACLOJK_026595 [Asimina triloba]